MVIRRCLVVAVEPCLERGTCRVHRIDATLDRTLAVTERQERGFEVSVTRDAVAALLDGSQDSTTCSNLPNRLRLENDDAQRALMDCYERIVDEVTNADPEPFDDSAQRVVWAVCWPRKAACDHDLLQVHWSYLERASYLCDLENATLLSLGAQALAEAAGQPCDLAAQAAEAALCWERGTRRAAELRHSLAPDARRRSLPGLWDYGVLGVAADGAVARAWQEMASWALSCWEDAVMDELQVRTRGLMSPHRIAHGLTTLGHTDSDTVARTQAASTWEAGAGKVFEREALLQMARLVQERTGLAVTSDDLMAFDGADGDWTRSAAALGEAIRPRFENAVYYAGRGLPWPEAVVGEDEALDEPTEERPWHSCLWDDPMGEAVFARETCVSTMFAGYGPRLTESLGPRLAGLVWGLLRERAMAEVDDRRLLAGIGHRDIWGVEPVGAR